MMLHNGQVQLDGVDVFVRVVEAGGFSAAARLLGMPATTVSAKIARLEERLGTTLIQRSTRRMHVTAAGDAYYRHCRDALAALAAGEDELAAATSEPNGLLKLTVPYDLAQTLLPPIVAEYLRRYAGTSIEVIATNAQLDLLAEGVDLAIRAAPALKDSSLQVRKFGSARLKLFASAAYLAEHGTPERLADLADHEILVHSRFPPGLVLTGDNGETFEITQTARARADDMHSVRAFAVHGLGIAVLPEVIGASPEGQLVQVLPSIGLQMGSLNFVFPGGRFTAINVRAFIDLTLEMLPS
jgi:DNA-binding transcriptional LysR family regulator